MAIICATLAHEVDGKVEYIYPKTIAEIVEYDDSDSVKSKIEKLDQDIVDANTRITNVVKNIEDGTLGANNDELVNIRIPNYNVVPEGTTYESAGDAVRGQFDEVIKAVEEVKSQVEKNATLINSNKNQVTANSTVISSIQSKLETIESEEVINIRTPNYNVVPEGTTYESAGDAVRGQFDAVVSLIDLTKQNIQDAHDTDIEDLKQNIPCYGIDLTDTYF